MSTFSTIKLTTPINGITTIACSAAPTLEQVFSTLGISQRALRYRDCDGDTVSVTTDAELREAFAQLPESAAGVLLVDIVGGEAPPAATEAEAAAAAQRLRPEPAWPSSPPPLPAGAAEPTPLLAQSLWYQLPPAVQQLLLTLGIDAETLPLALEQLNVVGEQVRESDAVSSLLTTLGVRPPANHNTATAATKTSSTATGETRVEFSSSSASHSAEYTNSYADYADTHEPSMFSRLNWARQPILGFGRGDRVGPGTPLPSELEAAERERVRAETERTEAVATTAAAAATAESAAAAAAAAATAPASAPAPAPAPAPELVVDAPVAVAMPATVVEVASPAPTELGSTPSLVAEPPLPPPSGTPSAHDVAMAQLIDMGFTDMALNARLLGVYGGNVEAVLANLLG